MDYKANTYDSNASRRQFIRRLGFVGMGAFSCTALLNSCGNRNDSSSKELKLFATGTLDIKDKWKQTLQDLGVRINFTDNNNDTGPVIAQMVAGTAAEDYDLGGLQGGAERELAEANVIKPWDIAKLPNWTKVWEWARNVPYASFEGKQYGLPIVINADSMIYLPDKVGEITTYEAIFDRKYRGKTSMEDAWINSVIFTAIYLKQNGKQRIDDPGNLTPDELGGVMEFLIKKKREGQFIKFWSGWEDGLRLVRSGEAWVMTGWEPIVYAAKREGLSVEYAIPQEGYEGWSNDLILHRGAQSRNRIEIAHAFANWELGGFYGCALADLRGYVVPNDQSPIFARQNAGVGFDPERIQSTVRHVQDKFTRQRGNVFWQNVRPKHYKLYEEWWSKLRSV